MLIDCSTCVARDIACGDCVMTILIQRPPIPMAVPPAAVTAVPDDPVEFDDLESRAIGALVAAGLVPPLRLVQPLEGGPQPDSSANIRGIA